MDMDRNIHVHRYSQLLPPLFIEKSNWKYLTEGYEESVQDLDLELEVEENFSSEGQTSLWCLLYNSSSLSQHFQEWFSILSALKWDWGLLFLKGQDDFSKTDPLLWSGKMQGNQYQLTFWLWQLLAFGNAIGCEVSAESVHTHNLPTSLHGVSWQEEMEEILQ